MRKRILIVDDDSTNRAILNEVLSHDFDLAEALNGDDCLSRMRDFGPDLVLLDIMMPGIDGYEVCRRIKSAPNGELVLIALVSGRASTDDRLEGYRVGADDFITKPFDHDELLARVKILFRLRGTLMELARANSEAESHNGQLERLVRERAAEVVETRDVTVFALAKLAESRDPETGEHLERMREYTQLLAEELEHTGPYTGDIDATFLNDLYLSSPMHDIGKVGIPDIILLKPGRLSSSEYEIMKRHTLIGAEALEEAAGHTKSGGFLKMAASVARSHHERFDGSGYPEGIAGLEIPLVGRIVALADVFDALTSIRVYKTAFTPDVAKAMIDSESGKHFDPAIVEAFDKTYQDFLRMCEEHHTVREQPLAVG